MSTIVSGDGSLQDEGRKFSAPVRLVAHCISWIFHPLFIPLYVSWFLLYVHPSAFVALHDKVKLFKLIFVFANTALFPGLAVFLMWRLKFIQSIYLRTQKERIIPYAAAMVFYFWAWYVSRSLKDNHVLFMDFLFASFLTVIAAWLANIYFKISMHALAIGGMAFFIVRATFMGDGTNGLYPSIALLIAGLVCTARMIVSDHKPAEIYLGILLGVLCQVLSILL